MSKLNADIIMVTPNNHGWQVEICGMIYGSTSMDAFASHDEALSFGQDRIVDLIRGF